MTQRIPIIDSHTAGEPTRVVISGGPDLGGGNVADRLVVFRQQHDDFRRAVVTEPRGSDVLVGALLVPSIDPTCITGVIYFDNVTFLGMCGHGTIGLVVTLAHLGLIQPGDHRIETPVGVVKAVLHNDSLVSLENVSAYRKAKSKTIEVPDYGLVTGDVAWGGNWFFFVEHHLQPLDLANVELLTAFSSAIRKAVNAQDFPEVDHIVLLGPPCSPHADSKNFVLCPGNAYDRSPCGTGTSARLACLAADGRIAEGEILVQESIIGSSFCGSFKWLDRENGLITPTITGKSFVTGEGHLLFNECDPFRQGISNSQRQPSSSAFLKSSSIPTGRLSETHHCPT